jgi:mannose-6-phosphate isomerase-like protein (cupin superfamily)
MKRKTLALSFTLLVVVSAFGLAQITPPENTEPDLKKFVNSWKDAKTRKMLGSLKVRDILTKTKGDPLNPRKKGAVLTKINYVSYATLAKKKSTDLTELENEQILFYTNSGDGTITSHGMTKDLAEGIGVLMPPGVEFTISNTGDEDLAMYIISEPVPDGFTPRSRMVVKDEFENKISSNLSRTNRTKDMLFGLDDGLSTFVAVNTIMFEPKSFVPLHYHESDIEEVWIALKGDIQIQIGTQRGELPEGSAYKAPADGRTPHTNINSSDVSRKLMWMMGYPVERSRTPSNNVM